ncbi:MAG: hypothetical protein ACE5EM_07700 [Sphingomonadales bacterium]
MRKTAKNKRRKARGSGQVSGGEARNDKPTAQTRAKLKPDPLWALAQRGVLSNEQIQAAWDIRAAFEIITVPVRLRLASLEKIDCGAADHRESERSIRLLKQYNAWIDEMTRYRLPAGPVLDIVVESLSCREVDRRRRVRKGTARNLLVEALDLYCKVVGWPLSGRRLAS